MSKSAWTPSEATDRDSVRARIRQEAVVVTPETRLRELLYRLSQEEKDAAVVADPYTQLPLGLVTLRDLLHAIGFEGGTLEDPVTNHMLGAPPTLVADAPIHRAKVMMAKRGVRYLILTEPSGALYGLLSQTDLLGLPATDADELIAEIGRARDLLAMLKAVDRIRRRGVELFRAGLGIESLAQWLSGLNDLIAIRVIELIEDESDLPPVSWCWITLGSEGRLEPSFRMEQDNALLFVPPDPASTPEVRQGLLTFARAVNEALHRLGFSHCPDGVMAGHPDWCLSESEWQARFLRWLQSPTPANDHPVGCLDFRPLYGSAEPVDRLRAWLIQILPEHPEFLRHLAVHSLRSAPPLGWMGPLRLGRLGQGLPRFDLKRQGARFFIEAARIWALKDGLWVTHTADRLRASAANRQLSAETCAAEIDCFQFIEHLRLEQQLRAPAQDSPERIRPEALKPLQRLMLKESLNQARALQTRLRREFT